MTVWDVQHPQPRGGVEFEIKLARQWYDDAQKQLATSHPKDAASLTHWRELAGGGVAAILGRAAPKAGEVEFEKTEETDLGETIRFAGLVRFKQHEEELPIAFLHPKKWNKRVVLWLSEQGKAGIFTADGGPTPETQKLLDAGVSVVGVDLLFQGEFLADGKPPEKNRRVGNNREFTGYTLGYNHSLLAQRVHDVLTTVAMIQHNDQQPEGIAIVALDGTAPIAAVAASQLAAPNLRLAIDTQGFRFIKLADYLDANLLPGGAKYGDLPGFLSLATDARLWLAGETAETAPLVKSAFAAAGKPDGVTFHGKQPDVQAAAVQWLIK
jgi:hypothetical protein